MSSIQVVSVPCWTGVTWQSWVAGLWGTQVGSPSTVVCVSSLAHEWLVARSGPHQATAVTPTATAATTPR